MNIEELTSPQMKDGISAIPSERISQAGELLTYLGGLQGNPVMMVAVQEAGERVIVHPMDCSTGE
ncbi:hypothetical protein A9Q96_14930 [Rhodobacterales bacterium 52_120_T64]|nr:hypothetical protein A9Q96_14930 [Rhodobacterales bacterium 52_120_T64]